MTSSTLRTFRAGPKKTPSKNPSYVPHTQSLTHQENTLKGRRKQFLNFSLSAQSSVNEGGVIEALANGAIDVIVVQR